MTQPNVQPNPEAIPLSLDPASLVAEWKALDEAYSQLQQKNNQAKQMITMAENTIADCDSQIKAVVAQLEILARIFNGMGVNPNEYAPPEEKSDPKPPKKSK